MKFLEVNPSLKKYFGNEGTFTDPRDGNTYKTVIINDQVWLAENLKYRGVAGEFPDDNPQNVLKYGYLYTWDNALKACPDGWHLPSKEEFLKLFKATGNSSGVSALHLSSKEWYGTDSVGFNALPAGSYCKNQWYDFEERADFWGSTININNSICTLEISNSVAILIGMSKECAFSVRCIKD